MKGITEKVETDTKRMWTETKHTVTQGDGSYSVTKVIIPERRNDRQRQQLDLALGVDSFRRVRSQVNKRKEDEHNLCSV